MNFKNDNLTKKELLQAWKHSGLEVGQCKSTRMGRVGMCMNTKDGNAGNRGEQPPNSGTPK